MYHNKGTTRTECVCSNPQFIIYERKSLSHVIAFCLLVSFFIFVGGYFLGKRTATQNFLQQFEQDSFADRIHHSLHTLYSQNATNSELIKQVEPQPGVTIAQEDSIAIENSLPDGSGAEEKLDNISKEPACLYHAQLFGGTQDAAKRCSALLAQHGIVTNIIKRSSKTARSNLVYWYQVVTDRFADKAALEDLVVTIKRIAKLHDVKIVKG